MAKAKNDQTFEVVTASFITSKATDKLATFGSMKEALKYREEKGTGNVAHFPDTLGMGELVLFTADKRLTDTLVTKLKDLAILQGNFEAATSLVGWSEEIHQGQTYLPQQVTSLSIDGLSDGNYFIRLQVKGGKIGVVSLSTSIASVDESTIYWLESAQEEGEKVTEA